MSPPQPPPGFVQLILSDPLYLEVPIHTILSLCLKPRKYLCFIGWCVLGVVGSLIDGQGQVITDLDGDLVDQGVYRYLVPGANPLAHAIDLEVIKARTQVPSQTTNSREGFGGRLLARDGACWLRHIVDTRPNVENLDSLDINDIRNGIYASDTIYDHYFDQRIVVVLKTPNPILLVNDIPVRYQRPMGLNPLVSYPPPTHRYTMQWLVDPLTWGTLMAIPNNNDATFHNHHLPKPADLLLHYNYGAAAVKQWGKNISVLQDRPNIPCLLAPIAVPMGPPQKIHPCEATIKKCADHQKQQAKAGRSGPQDGDATADAAVESEAPNVWDEDDVMLFFWGNSKVAQERHAQKEKEHTEYMDDWRTAVIPGPFDE
ncbi:hypothetical protein B0H10DRAFT_1937691 [Mycena sp. CBHHK59/15]|nr:hypothetical protein B0H10DRAFT_1937691 [Mycena sp. CBHHK59/15]